jgi:serine/threonine-protein kinase RsbW
VVGSAPEVGVTTVPEVSGVIGLRVPGAIAYRHLAIRLITTACKMALERDPAAADNDFESEVVSAFGEAFNNIAIHGYRDLTPEPVQIEVDWDDEKLVITFIDTGHIFHPETVAPPDLDELNEHGMGLFIMKSCMDEVDYRPGPPNVLRLVKLRARRDGLLPPAPASGDGLGPASSPVSSSRSATREVDSAVARGAEGGAGVVTRGDRGSGVHIVVEMSGEGAPPSPGGWVPGHAGGAAPRPPARAIR